MKKELILGVGVLLIGGAVFLSHSCKKHQISPEYSKAQFNIKMMSGTSALELDTVKYINAAGNKFGMSVLNCFVSSVTLKRADGKLYVSNKVFYIDPAVSSKSYFNLDSIPPGDYTQVTFYIGLDAAKNKTNTLPATSDNINMAWPTAMGGGYHFMKMEGHYLDTLNVKKGYAIHMGKNDNLITAKINFNMHQKYWDHKYTLYFDINEVFANPYTYNLNFDPNYTMSDSVAMLRIKNNMTDAFSLIQNN